MIAGGAKIDAPGYLGKQPVHNLTVNAKDTSLLEYFFNKLGVAIDARTTDGNTPLHTAAEDGTRAVISYLLKLGAQIETRNDKQETPLLLAAGKGNVVAIEMLLKEGANIESPGNPERDWPPLVSAARSGQRAAAEMLLNHGAKIGGADKYGNTALNWACINGHPEVAKLVMARGANIESAGAAGWHPLHHAAGSKYIVGVQNSFTD